MALAGVPMFLVAVFLIMDFAICRMMDSRLLAMYGTPPNWYLPLRTRLTILVTIALSAFLISAL